MKATNEIIYDLDNITHHMESILSKYIQLPEGCVYLKGHREAILDRSNLDRYTKMGMVSGKPFHPVIAPAILRDAVLHVARSYNPHKESLVVNPLTGVYDEVYPNPYNNLESILLHYAPSITTGDVDKLLNYIEKALDPIFSIMHSKPEYVYGVCIKTRFFKFICYEDIRAIRFNEAMVQQEAVCE